MRNFSFVVRDLARRAGQRMASVSTRNGFENEAKSELVLQEFGLSLDPKQHAFFLKDLWFARKLKDDGGAVFSLTDTNELLIQTPRFRAIIQTEEELFILHEILVSRIYDFAHRRPVVVLDVGFNVGLAALYFAALESVIAVEGYEPFARTFAQAQRNLELNEPLATKITAHNTGLGARKRSIAVQYCYEWKGMVGINGVPEKRRNGYSISMEDITLSDVGEALDCLVEKYPGIDLLAKIDCEGAEYELVDALCSAARIKSIKLIMMEWHDRGSQPLVDALTTSGFSTFCLRNDTTTGLIYAVQN